MYINNDKHGYNKGVGSGFGCMIYIQDSMLVRGVPFVVVQDIPRCWTTHDHILYTYKAVL